MTRANRYIASFKGGPMELSPGERDLIRRRTLPFLVGGETRSLETLLAEVYLQGIRDAVDTVGTAK